MEFKQGDIYFDLGADLLIRIDSVVDTHTYTSSVKSIKDIIWFSTNTKYQFLYLAEEINKGNIIPWTEAAQILYS